MRGVRKSGLDQMVADGVEHQLAHGVDAQFAQDVGAVRVHRLDADSQQGRDFLGGAALGDVLDDFAFPGRQPFARGGFADPARRGIQKLLQHQGRDGGVKNG